MINTINLPPFKKMCVTIGNLPSSFMESMSYYEALCWLVDYLEKQVVPAVNTNSEAITELQNYVANYFDNLDVQEEINNKLDDMAQDGSLETLIKTAIIYNQYDVPTLFIGDSYGAGYQGSGITPIKSWCGYVKDKLGISDDNYYINVESGAGFSQDGWYNHNFEDLISIVDVHNNENEIKRIIICGGYNDSKSNYSTVLSSINTTITTAKTRFPNAEIYIGEIGNDGNVTSDGQNTRYKISTISIPAYQTGALNNGCHYLNGVENALKDYTLFISDNFHPTSNGQQKLGNAIYESIVNGVFQETTQIEQISVSSSNINSYSHLYERIVNDHYQLIITTSNFGIFNSSMTFSNNQIDLGLFNLKYKRANGSTDFIETIPVVLKLNNVYYEYQCKLTYTANNHLILEFNLLNSADGTYFIDGQSTNRINKIASSQDYIVLTCNLINC